MLDQLAKTLRQVTDLVAERLGWPADDFGVYTMAGAFLGVMLSAELYWLEHPGSDLFALLDDALASGVGTRPLESPNREPPIGRSRVSCRFAGSRCRALEHRCRSAARFVTACTDRMLGPWPTSGVVRRLNNETNLRKRSDMKSCEILGGPLFMSTAS